MKRNLHYCKSNLKGTLLSVLACLGLFVSFNVNAQSTALRRPISPQQPMWLIHIDTWNQADPQKIIDMVPADIRPYVVFNISLSINHNATDGFLQTKYGYETAKTWLRTCAENRVWAMIQQASGGIHHFPEYSQDNDMKVWEEFYRDYPNFLGFNFAEQFWGFDDPNDPYSASWADRITTFTKLMEMSHKYGGYLLMSWCGAYYGAGINPVAIFKRNAAFASICSQYPQNFILCEKFTSRYGFYDIESTSLGAYLSGFSGQYGIRFDETGWTGLDGESDGDADDSFPVAAGTAPVLEHVMLTGQTVIDGPELIMNQCSREISTGTTSDGYTTRQWEFFPQFYNVSMDMFRKVLDGTVRILNRQEVIDRTKLVVVNDVSSGSDQDKYSAPMSLFDGLYRNDTFSDPNLMLWNRSWFKKTGRYPAIPTVYQLADDKSNSFQVKVNKSAYATRWPSNTDKVNEFNSLFPQEYTGDIYAGRQENGWVTYNPKKDGANATGSIPFKYNTCDRMEVNYAPYTTAVVKEFSNKLTFYLTNYTPGSSALKTDVIKIYGSSSKPTYSFTDRADHQASSLSESWSGGVYTLTVNHNGALDITVNCAGTATGRLTSYKEASVVAPLSPTVYSGPRQYEAEYFDYKNIGGNTANGVSGSILNYTGLGYLRFGNNSAASIKETVNVPYAGSYTIQTKYSLTGGDVSNINIYVNGSNAATPSFTQTGSTSTWAVNSQTVNLNAGNNTIEFRASGTGQSNLYFDNITVTPSQSSGNTVQENATGFCSVDGAVETEHAGYTGAGYANTTNVAGTAVNWKLNFASIGTKSFKFRYASTSDRTADLFVNGSKVATDISFPSSGSWSVWTTATVLANTVDGIADVRLVSKVDAGLPNIDNLQVTGASAANCSSQNTLYTIQENEAGFCGIDGAIENNYLGYLGDGFANTVNASGAGVDWNINFSSSGSKTFTFRYATSSDRTAKLIINGVTAVSGINFTSTGAWSTWNTLTVNANVSSGVNNIRLEATNSAGLPNVDYIGFTGGTPVSCSPSSAIATFQENETGFCSVDGTIDTDHLGYSGNGFANTSNASGAGISWKANFAAYGTKSFTFRYASPDDRLANLIVNGVTVASNINMISTGGWSSWGLITIDANTSGGIVDVRLEATGSNGLPNVDYMEVTDGTPTSCSSSESMSARSENKALEIEDQESHSLVIYPNPAESILNVSSPDQSGTFIIYNTMGAEVSRSIIGKSGLSKIDVSSLVPGVYIYQLNKTRGKFVKK